MSDGAPVVAEVMRAEVRRAVELLVPVDARESASQLEVLEGLEHLARPFDVDADVVHVTGSALVVGHRGIVLHRHKRLGLWLQPGGHVDAGEWPHQAAVREAREETGLAVTHLRGSPLLLHVDAHDGGRGHRHLDLRYVLAGDDGDPAPPVGESPDCRWFDWEEARAIADDGLVGVLDRLRAVTTT